MEVVSIISSAVLSIAAIIIAIIANRVSTKSAQLEADKHLFEWGQRVLRCFSEVTALRLTPNTEINHQEFKKKRRELRSEIYALHGEGQLFFTGNKKMMPSDNSLDALEGIANLLDGRKFLPPEANDYKTKRAPQTDIIKTETKKFVFSIQNKIGSQWT